jgi:hypothetical protein
MRRPLAVPAGSWAWPVAGRCGETFGAYVALTSSSIREGDPMPEQPTEEEIRTWHRWFAVECNNRAWSLSETATRSEAEDAEMLHAAHAAALHWSRVGTEHNVALADMLVGHVHALLGHGDLAMHYAATSFAYFTGRDSEAWELAFAHAVLANAAWAAQDVETHARHYALAEELGRALADAEDREIFEATFRRIPVA